MFNLARREPPITAASQTQTTLARRAAGHITTVIRASLGLSPTMIIGLLMAAKEDDDELAPAHRNLAPVPEHTCTNDCRHREDARDFVAAPATRCGRCGEVSWRMWNLRIKKCKCAEGVSCDHLTGMRREFMCLNDKCRMRWWEH